jgi:hypothetical protein
MAIHMMSIYDVARWLQIFLLLKKILGKMKILLESSSGNLRELEILN